MKNKNKELLFSVTKKDLKIEATKGSGPGGQHRNKKDTAIRITHIESGAVGYSCDQRSQLQNKRKAFLRMANSKEFKLWQKKKIAKVLLGKEQIKKEVQQAVNNAMNEENLKIEYFDPS